MVVLSLGLVTGCSSPTSVILDIRDSRMPSQPLLVSVFDARGGLPISSGMSLVGSEISGPGRFVIDGLEGNVALRALVIRRDDATWGGSGRLTTSRGRQVSLVIDLGDLTGKDLDGDGIPDDIDNCGSVANASQADGNGNGVGEACEAGEDGGAPLDLTNSADASIRDLEATDGPPAPDLPIDLGSVAADLLAGDLATPVADLGACGVLQLTGGSAQAPTLADYTVTDFTLEAWVRSSSANTGAAKNIVGHWGHLPGATGSYAVYLDNQNPTFAFTCDGSNLLQLPSSTPLQVDTWAHVAVVFDGGMNPGNARIYVNGVQTGSTTFGCTQPHPASNLPFQIAYHDSDGGGSMQGYVDEVRLSNIVRYTANFTPPAFHTADANTVALFRFDGTGSSLTDASSRANHAVTSGGAAQTTLCR